MSIIHSTSFFNVEPTAALGRTVQGLQQYVKAILCAGRIISCGDRQSSSMGSDRSPASLIFGWHPTTRRSQHGNHNPGLQKIEEAQYQHCAPYTTRLGYFIYSRSAWLLCAVCSPLDLHEDNQAGETAARSTCHELGAGAQRFHVERCSQHRRYSRNRYRRKTTAQRSTQSIKPKDWSNQKASRIPAAASTLRRMANSVHHQVKEIVVLPAFRGLRLIIVWWTNCMPLDIGLPGPPFLGDEATHHSEHIALK